MKGLCDGLWNGLLIYAIPLAGIFLTLRTRGVQISGLWQGLRGMCASPKKQGEVSPFGALCTALSATMGTGNIVGVATAVCLGGPGSLLWMELAAFFGMAVKYAEATLAVTYRRQDGEGYWGGPFCYMEDGLGHALRPLAKGFAFCGVIAGTFGIGTSIQVNSIATAWQGAVGCQADSPACLVTNLLVATAVTLAVGLVIKGGGLAVTKISQYVVPLMSAVYVGLLLWVILSYRQHLPAALGEIWRSAFCPSAVLGSGCGLTVRSVMRVGIGRGIFSNEAGLGSSSIADATVTTSSATQQGLVSMWAVLMDTMVVCTLTGLAVVVTDAYRMTGLAGAQVTAYALCQGLPFSAKTVGWLLAGCLTVFAFTSILGWYFYASQCLRYLLPRKQKAGWFSALFLAGVTAGPFLSVAWVWDFADLCNGLMALPNLLAVMLLSGVVARQTKKMTRCRTMQRAVGKLLKNHGLGATNRTRSHRGSRCQTDQGFFPVGPPKTHGCSFGQSLRRWCCVRLRSCLPHKGRHTP